MCLLFQLVQLDVQFPLETMLEIHVNVIGPHEIVNHVFILFGIPEGKHWKWLKNQSRWILLLSPTGTLFIRFWSKMKRESYLKKNSHVSIATLQIWRCENSSWTFPAIWNCKTEFEINNSNCCCSHFFLYSSEVWMCFPLAPQTLSDWRWFMFVEI